MPPANADDPTIDPEDYPEVANDPSASANTAAYDPGQTAPLADSAPQTGSQPLPTFPGYQILGLLGRGGMGVVYKALDVKLKRLVALKVILAGSHAGKREHARFRAEAETIARLQHPNIVQIYEIGEHDGKPFIALEFCAGGSLDSKLNGTPLVPKTAARLVQTLARAMHAAHKAQVIHRDLKPANVLLQIADCRLPIENQKEDLSSKSAIINLKSEIPKITDFGLAKQLDAGTGQTQSGAIMGTPSYMPPEQAGGAGAAVTPAADIYALGAILYEFLTGRPPFKAATPLDTILQVVAEEPVPPSRLNSKLPRDLETICLKCLAKEPHKRYRHARALAADLGRFIAGEPIEARPTSAFERTLKWCRRRPALAALMVLATLALFTLTGVSVRLGQERDRVIEQQKRTRAILRIAFQAVDRVSELSPEPDSVGLFALQMTSERRQHVEEAIEMYRGFLDKQDDAPEGRTEVGLTNSRLATMLLLVGKLDQAKQAIRKAITNQEQLDAESPGDPEIQYDLARSRTTLGHLLFNSGKTDAAAQTYHQALVALEPLAQQHPADSKYQLALAEDYRNLAVLKLTNSDFHGAEGFFDKELAIFTRLVTLRPQLADFQAKLAMVHCNLGMIYNNSERPEKAEKTLLTGLSLFDKLAGKHPEMMKEYGPILAASYMNLGLSYSLLKRPSQSHSSLEKALAISEKLARAQPNVLSHAQSWVHAYSLLAETNDLRHQEAVDLSKRGLALVEKLAKEPGYANLKLGLRVVLMRQYAGDEVWADWRQALDQGPSEHADWFGYAELCLFLEKTDEYHRARKELLDRFGASVVPEIAERTGRACLLLPASEAEFKQAVALIDRAVAVGPKGPYYAYAKLARGLAEYRADRFENTIALLEREPSKIKGELEPVTPLLLAMSQYQQGQKDAARKAFAVAVRDHNWDPAGAAGHDQWICHILLREAGKLILPNMPAFLARKYEPLDNDERFGLLAICESKRLHSAAARLLAGAFANDPKLADDLKAKHRYRAACQAARAAAGQDEDAKLDDQAKVHWRQQALDWLRADLAAQRQQLESRQPAQRAAVKREMNHWLADRDFRSLRDGDAPAKLAPDEQDAWQQFWADVETLRKQVDAAN